MTPVPLYFPSLCVPPHGHPQEAANKHAVLTADNIQVLVARLQTDALLQQNALQVQGILEILTLALNLPPVSDAEAERQWQLVRRSNRPSCLVATASESPYK